MALLADKIRDSFLICPICEDIYTDPRTLSCLHSFCLLCLQRWAENVRLENSIRCPTCRNVTKFSGGSGVNSLPKSFLLENLREAVDTYEDFDVKHCSRCVVKAACKSCDELLCEHCFTEHRTDVNLQSHKVIRLSDEDLCANERLTGKDEASKPAFEGNNSRWAFMRRSLSCERSRIKSLFVRRSTSADRQEPGRRAVSPTVEERSAEGLSTEHNVTDWIGSNTLPRARDSMMTETQQSGRPALSPSVNPSLSLADYMSISTTRSPTRAYNHMASNRQAPIASSVLYLGAPRLRHVIRGNPSRPVWGVAVLGANIYIVTYCTSVIDIYSSMNFEAVGSISVDGMKDPWDIAACSAHHCLFVCDWRNRSVFRVRRSASSHSDSLNGSAQRWLQLEHHPRGLSVSRDGSSLIVVCSNFRDVTYDSLRVYDASASKRPRLIRKVRLSGLDSVWQAVGLGGGGEEEGFAVCHGGRLDRVHQVCRVDKEGRVRGKFGGDVGCGRDQLNMPSSLCADGLNQVFVADHNNSRVLLLSAGSLRLQRRLLGQTDGVEKPRRLCLDEGRGVLYVGQDNGDVRVYVVSEPRLSSSSSAYNQIIQGAPLNYSSRPLI